MWCLSTCTLYTVQCTVTDYSVQYSVSSDSVQWGRMDSRCVIKYLGGRGGEERRGGGKEAACQSDIWARDCTVLYNCTLHPTTLYNTVRVQRLFCTVQHWTELNRTVHHCTVTALHCHSTVLYSTTLPCTSLHYHVMYSTTAIHITAELQKGLFSRNQPAAQAAGADPSRCNSTNRPNPALQ